MQIAQNFDSAVSFCKLAKIICRIFAVCTLGHFIMRIYESAAQFFSFFAGLCAAYMQFRLNSCVTASIECDCTPSNNAFSAFITQTAPTFWGAQIPLVLLSC